ncbi:MAG: cell division protein ZapA [Gammaproteobacteria bacterium]|jgi:cell division protein ZapA
MTSGTSPVSVKILDKEFQIACSDEERSALLAAANFLHTRMKEIRDSGKVVGMDRIAIMAALNLTHELLLNRSEREELSHTLSTRIRSLQDRIEQALENVQQMEL